MYSWQLHHLTLWTVTWWWLVYETGYFYHKSSNSAFFCLTFYRQSIHVLLWVRLPDQSLWHLLDIANSVDLPICLYIPHHLKVNKHVQPITILWQCKHIRFLLELGEMFEPRTKMAHLLCIVSRSHSPPPGAAQSISRQPQPIGSRPEVPSVQSPQSPHGKQVTALNSC